MLAFVCLFFAVVVVVVVVVVVCCCCLFFCAGVNSSVSGALSSSLCQQLSRAVEWSAPPHLHEQHREGWLPREIQNVSRARETQTEASAGPLACRSQPSAHPTCWEVVALGRKGEGGVCCLPRRIQLLRAGAVGWCGGIRNNNAARACVRAGAKTKPRRRYSAAGGGGSNAASDL